MPDLYNVKSDCCGCSGCYDVCPKKAITMIEDSEGFRYPVINEAKCINCNLCERICPTKNIKPSHSLLEAYAAYNLDENIRLESSSGGIFTLLANEVINNNGIVYGAAFDENLEVRHIRVDNASDLSQLRGSKYAQSNCDNIFRNCKEDLNNGKEVLFTGTPCQVAAVKSFLNKDYDNLLCMDIICHGVPSRKIWRSYVEYRGNFAKSKIAQIAFRLKNEGWKQYAVKFTFANLTAYCQKFPNDIFMRGFLSDLYLRPSCYKCGFKTQERISDVTVADFWGIDRLHPEWDDDKGMTLLVVHSPKGKAVIEKVKKSLFIEKVAINDAILSNPAMIRSANEHKSRKEFFDRVNSGEEVWILVDKFTKPSIASRIKQKIKSVIKRLLFRK